MADTSVKLSGTYDSIEAYSILEEMQEMSADYEAIRTEAAAAASAATAASAAATNAINTANAAVSNAQTYAGNASDSADDAAGYAVNASTSATNAASSATDASNSAAAASTSETNAAASATAAAASEAVVNGALPLSGGTMTGALNTANNIWNNLGDDAAFGDHNVAGKMCVKTQTSTATGIVFFNNSDTNVGQMEVNNAFNFNKAIKQNGIDLTPQKSSNQGTASDVNVPNNTTKNLMSFTLTKGTWFVQAIAGFTGNSNGYRRLGISTNTSSMNADRFKVVDGPSTGSTTTHLSLTTVIAVSSTTTYYINVLQTSGSTLATSGGYVIFKLSDDV